MQTYVLLLGGVNVGGARKLPMAGLRELLESLGLADVRTYVQSGNAVFRSAEDAPSLTASIEAAIAERYGFESPALVLSADELARIAAADPFVRDDPAADPKPLAILFLFEPVDPTRESALRAALPPTEDEFVLTECAVYLRCPGGFGRSPLSNAFFERKLKVAGTARNWRTVTTLLEMTRPGQAPRDVTR